MSYTAPVNDMLFVMKELAGLDDIAALPGYEDANADTAQAVLDESAKFCGEVLAPLNVDGDRHPSTGAGSRRGTPILRSRTATRSSTGPRAGGR